MIGIIGAMKIEIEKIDSLIQNKSEKQIAGTLFVSGTLNGKEIVTAVCGIGKVAAAMCAQTMIMAYSPDCIINTGVAGSLSDKAGILDTVIADSLVEHDMDTTALGGPPGFISGIDTVYFPADKYVSSLLFECASGIGGFKAITGRIASGDQFVASAEKKDKIVAQFDACACEMEGAAIAHTCFCNRVPFGVIRAISDCADGSSHMDYAQFLPQAAAAAAEIIRLFVEKYEK